MTKVDADEIAQSWVETLRQPKAEAEKDTSWPTWAIVLVIVGGVLVVAPAVLVPVFVISAKK